MIHELRIERLIDAPVATVWQAWTEHFAEWFVPRPWTVEVVEQDLRTGGRSAMVMRGPEGESNPSEGVFLEVVPGRRIVSTDAFRADWEPQEPFMVRIDEFADAEGKTRYTAIARHWTVEARDQHAAMGFEAGWNAATDQLEEVVRRIAAEPSVV
ncbi:SRPBCC family protein [Sphingomonas radiodurans]|uniref:SRPBCC family protein n=1 Tax=Sphingomonas radiodurans TaxID=2890321 RepID=UPI001E34A288|nr:SRPBCC family protein [Sphingomonas radiodurans]WBH15602.1 SRPBCC family protein [Sphingomonas radiodurans]